MTLDDIDKTGLIRESYAIEGISDPECRSIFVDWALKLPEAMTPKAAIERLLAHYGVGNEDHPMTTVLKEGMVDAGTPKRRGGRSARVGGTQDPP